MKEKGKTGYSMGIMLLCFVNKKLYFWLVCPFSEMNIAIYTEAVLDNHKRYQLQNSVSMIIHE